MSEKLKDSFIAILLLNYKGWRDTIACLESLLRLDCQDFFVIICDNNSPDGSLRHIQEWAAGQIQAVVPSHPTLIPLVSPPIPKPIPVSRLSRMEAENPATGPLPKMKVFLIDTGSNRGFAAGNNVGLRCVLRRTNATHVWLLNNDTVVKADALTHLLRRSRENDLPGITGSTLMFFDHPDTAQAYGGGIYSPWTGRSTILGGFSHGFFCGDPRCIEGNMNYVIGASMFVSRSFLERVGLMSEEYFLYFEEVDWAVRGKNEGFSLGYAPESIVYHREGASIGAYHPENDTRRSLYEIHIARSRMIFHDMQGGLVRMLIIPQFFIWFVKAVLRRHTHRMQALVKALCSFRKWRQKRAGSRKPHRIQR